MGIRFLRDGSLIRDGVSLEPGESLDREAAKKAWGASSAVFLHSYPKSVDITDDHARIQALLDEIALEVRLEGHTATEYRGEGTRVLVFEHHH